MVLRRPAVLLILAALVLAACGKATPSPTHAPAPTATPSPTALPPTPTATPAPPAVVLLAAPQADAGLKRAARAWLQALAQAKNARFVALDGGASLPPHTVVVLGVGVVPPATEGARRLAVAPPENANLKGAQVVQAATADLPHRAFLAGYIAAVVTYDWRGGLLASENEKTIAAAFEDGGRYFCGLCRPLHPPFLAYPQYALAPAGASAEEWGIAMRRLAQAKVKTLALSPAALAALSPAALPHNVTLLALEAPPANTTQQFAAAIYPDLAAALENLWQHPETTTTPLPLKIKVFDPGVVTPGKQRLIEAVRDRLQAGRIAP